MSDLYPDPGPTPAASARRWARPLLALLAVAVLLRVPVLAFDAGSRLPDVVARAQSAWRDPAAVRLQSVTGLTPESERLLRRNLGLDGRLVVYFPVQGTAQEQLLWEKLLRDEYERLKNLLYPAPRDAAFARNADELLRTLDPALVGRLVVVDGTPDGGELPVRAEFEPIGQQAMGPVTLRFWLLRKVAR